MINMKKMAAVLLAATLSVSCWACGSSDGENLSSRADRETVTETEMTSDESNAASSGNTGELSAGGSLNENVGGIDSNTETADAEETTVADDENAGYFDEEMYADVSKLYDDYVVVDDDTIKIVLKSPYTITYTDIEDDEGIFDEVMIYGIMEVTNKSSEEKLVTCFPSATDEESYRSNDVKLAPGETARVNSSMLEESDDAYISRSWSKKYPDDLPYYIESFELREDGSRVRMPLSVNIFSTDLQLAFVEGKEDGYDYYVISGTAYDCSVIIKDGVISSDYVTSDSYNFAYKK